jgi:hypothetical protein
MVADALVNGFAFPLMISAKLFAQTLRHFSRDGPPICFLHHKLH